MKKDERWITIEGVEVGSDHAQFLSCRSQTPEEPREPLPEVRGILTEGAFLPCLQCGTCVATCALSSLMAHPPRKFLRALALGQIEEALASNTLWLCLSCYQCTSRCPRGLKITDTLAALREAVARAQARQQREARSEACYAVLQQGPPGPDADPGPGGEPGERELRQQVLEELRRLHLEAKEQLFRYRKLVQKAQRSGKPQEALAYFAARLTHYRGTPWYEEMCRIRENLDSSLRSE